MLAFMASKTIPLPIAVAGEWRGHGIIAQKTRTYLKIVDGLNLPFYKSRYQRR